MTGGSWERIKELLHQAMQLAPEERGQFLADACVAEPGLRDEVESLLLAYANVPTDFLDVAPAVGELAAHHHRIDSAALEPGVAFAQNFRLVRRLGEGGMGQVWLAEQTSPVQRQVALKLIKAGMYDESVLQRFQAERQSLALMDHPAIAKVFDAGTTALGQPYFVMEFVAGLAITEYCDQRKLSIRARLELFVQACEGVQHAHQKAIIHRDLKPANILVVDVDGRPTPRIIDFGLAKATRPSPVGESLPTQLGRFMGTPGYMSPEQIDPNVHDIDTRTDVYSLGVVLYILLTGLQPFETKRERAPPLDELLRQLREDEPPSLSAKISADLSISAATAAARGTEPKALVSLLRGDLDGIARKALERDRDRRYGTPSELVADIRRYLNHEPVLARPASASYRFRKYVRRHRIAVSVAAGFALLLTFGALLQTWELRETTRQRERALSLVARNRAVQDFLDLLITDAAQSNQPVSVSDMLARSELLAAREFQDDPDDRAAVLDMLGNHYHTVGNEARAEPLQQQALEAVANSNDNDLQAQIHCDHASTVGALGKEAEARNELNAVINASGTSDEQAAECLVYLGYLARHANDAESAFKYSSMALERMRRAPHPSLSNEAVYVSNVGYAEHLLGHNAEAERDYAEALKLYARAGRDHSAGVIPVRNNWGLVSEGAGDSKRALEIFEQTLEIAQRDGSAQVSPYLFANLGRALENVGRYHDARNAYEKCAELAEKSSTASLIMYCVVGLASVALDQHDLLAAQGSLDRASAIPGTTVPAGSSAALALQLTKGRLALESGTPADARPLLTSVIDTQRPISTTIAALLARSALDLGESKLADASDDARRALSISQSLQGGIPYSSRTGLAWLAIGRVLLAQGNSRDAHDAFQSAVEHLSRTVDASYAPLLEAQQGLALPAR